ncbi:MAG: TIM barrel protein [Clostridia bacterium]|nr:TIM barrel protein [Clostridia bacterium]
MAKIGALLGYGPQTDIDAAFSKFQALGLNCCQLSVWDVENMFTPEKAEEAKAASAKYGIEITALWAGWTGPAAWNFTEGPATLGIVPAEYRAMRVQQLIKAADFAEWLGVTDIITHAGFLPESPCDPNFQPVADAIKEIAEVYKARGLWFLFETGQETPVAMLRYIETVGTGNLGINFDTANLILYGKANSVDALEVFGKYVRNTHFKDGLYPTCGNELGHEVALGDGKANVPGIIAKLKELNYQGAYVIEREISGDRQIADITKAKTLIESCL